MSELVSIIIPTYNRPNTLSRSIESALAQEKDSEVEVIVVNDGGNAEAVDKMLAPYPSIQLFHLSTNQGVSAARNYGIKQSKGSILLFLDDDDELDPSFLKNALQKFDKQVDVLIGDCELIGDSSDKHFKRVFAYNKFLNEQYQHKPIAHWGYFLQYMPPIHSLLFRRRLFDQYQFNEALTYGEDRELLLRMKHHCIMNKVPLLTGKYYFYPSHGQAPINKFVKVINPLLDAVSARSYAHLLLAYFWWKKGDFVKVITSMIRSLRSPYVVVKQFVLFLRLILLR